MCILVPAPLFLYLVPYLNQFSAVEFISAKRAVNLLNNLNNVAVTTPSNSSIWNEFSEQLKHLITKVMPYSTPNLHFLMQIRCRFNAHFGLVDNSARKREQYQEIFNITQEDNILLG